MALSPVAIKHFNFVLRRVVQFILVRPWHAESLVFVGVHAKYREITPVIMSVGLGLLMAFIAYGRIILKPIF